MPKLDNSGLGSAPARNHVCVIGLGAAGLAATKNLIEQGFKVTAFEKNSYVGGLWQFSLDTSITTALPATRSTVTKQRSEYTDFPMPDEYPTHPLSEQIELYLESYAAHFNLYEHVHFQTTVTSVNRVASQNVWRVFIQKADGTSEAQYFDRVVLASGMVQKQRMPRVKGIDSFSGSVIHSMEFKNPNEYKGKTVLIVGVGSSGADTACFLHQAGAKKLYLSHRHKFNIIPRILLDKPFDHWFTRRVSGLLRRLTQLSPIIGAKALKKALTIGHPLTSPFLATHPSFQHPHMSDGPLSREPMMSERLPFLLRDGEIETVRGIQEITGPSSVLFTDGHEVTDVDAIIFCTGYAFDFSILEHVCQTRCTCCAESSSRPHEEACRLYMGILSEKYPDSLAVLGSIHFFEVIFPYYDLATMALASVWAGNFPLPTNKEMENEINRQRVTASALSEVIEPGPYPRTVWRLDYKTTYDWMNRAAGTGVVERLDSWTSLESWKFWWNETRFYYLLQDGIDCPAVYRLFDTPRGRLAWQGARSHIEKTNRART